MSDTSKVATPQAKDWNLWKKQTWIFFVYSVGVIAALFIAALVVSAKGSRVHESYSFTSVVPLWVPWAGALGGATISLVGVVAPGRAWNPSFAYWHLAKPTLSAVTGTMGVLLVVLVLKSVSADAGTSPTYDARGEAVLAAISFVIGYREQAFREIVARVVDLILKPANSATAVVVFVPAALEFPWPGTGKASEQTTHVFNATADTCSLDASSLSVDPSNAGFTAALESGGSLAPNSSRRITVTWTPGPGGHASSAVLRATVGGRTVTAQLRGLPDGSTHPEEVVLTDQPNKDAAETGQKDA